MIKLLSDVGRHFSGPKYGGVSKTVAAHVVVVGNEGPHASYLHKEVWSLQIDKKYQEVVWHFPGEAPRTMAVQGWLGEVAQPWEVESEPEAHAALAAWRARDEAALVGNPRLQLQRALKNLNDEQVLAIQQTLGPNILLGLAGGRNAQAAAGGA